MPTVIGIVNKMAYMRPWEMEAKRGISTKLEAVLLGGPEYTKTDRDLEQQADLTLSHWDNGDFLNQVRGQLPAICEITYESKPVNGRMNDVLTGLKVLGKVELPQVKPSKTAAAMANS